MSTLVVTPSPALKGSVVRVDGMNFPNAKTRLLLDDVGSTTNIFRPAADGSFHVGITVSATVRVQTLVAQQADSKGRWAQVASVTIPVVTAPPSPQPVPTPIPTPPPPTGTPIPVGALPATIASAKPGTTYLVAPGQHQIPGLMRLTAAGVSIVAASTPPDLQVARNGLFVAASGTTVRGLHMTGLTGAVDGNGSANLEVDGQTPVTDTLIEDMVLSLPANANMGQHNLYLRGVVERLTARRVTSRGNGSQGAGLHGYHQGATPCLDITIEGWTFDGHARYAVLLWLPIRNLVLRDCTFTNCGPKAVRFLTGGTVVMERCKGYKGIELDPDNAAEGLKKTIGPVQEINCDAAWVPA